MKRALIILSGLLSIVYLLNPTMGIFEFLPDNIPVIGNLDEGAAAYVLISVISYLTGKDFGLFGSNEEEVTAKQIEKEETTDKGNSENA